MTKLYGNWHGDSGVSKYDDDLPDAIIIEYGGEPKKRYKFSDIKAGAANVRELKRLAKGGVGLAEFMNKNKNDLHGERLSE